MFADKLFDFSSVSRLCGNDMCRDLQFQIMTARLATKLDLDEASCVEASGQALGLASLEEEALAKECRDLEERRQALLEELQEKQSAGASIIASIEGSKERFQSQIQSLNAQVATLQLEQHQLQHQELELNVALISLESKERDLAQQHSQLMGRVDMQHAADVALADHAERAERAEHARVAELRQACEACEAEHIQCDEELTRWQNLNSFRAGRAAMKEQMAISASAAHLSAKDGDDALQLAERKLQSARWYPLASAILTATLCHGLQLLRSGHHAL